MTSDIKRLFSNVITADPAMISLLGITADDPRFYWYYQGDAVISAEKPSFITYALINANEAMQAVWQPIFSMQIWAKKNAHTEKVASRLSDLFHKKNMTTPTVVDEEGPREVYTKVIHQNDIFQEQPSYAGTAIHIRVGLLQIP
jgi:hypothetical protein